MFLILFFRLRLAKKKPSLHKPVESVYIHKDWYEFCVEIYEEIREQYFYVVTIE